MTQFNPFVPAILPSAQAQRQQSAERVTQVRRAQEAQKNAAQHVPIPKLPANDLGRPGTVGAALERPPWGYIDISPYYCAFSGLRAG